MNIFFFFLFLIISFIFFLLTMFLSYDRTVEKDSSVDFFPVLFSKGRVTLRNFFFFFFISANDTFRSRKFHEIKAL